MQRPQHSPPGTYQGPEKKLIAGEEKLSVFINICNIHFKIWNTEVNTEKIKTNIFRNFGFKTEDWTHMCSFPPPKVPRKWYLWEFLKSFKPAGERSTRREREDNENIWKSESKRVSSNGPSRAINSCNLSWKWGKPRKKADVHGKLQKGSTTRNTIERDWEQEQREPT